MREIDNNMSKLNFKGIQKAEETAPVENTAPAANSAESQTKEINDLSKMPSAYLGKSQVAADSIESDMAEMLDNPEKVSMMNNLFDKYAQEHSPEEALQMLEELKG